MSAWFVVTVTLAGLVQHSPALSTADQCLRQVAKQQVPNSYCAKIKIAQKS